MARLLARPNLVDRIALYGSGDQSMVVEILPFANSPTYVAELKARLPSLLGYWLYDFLLRFPGILVNATAAASYLDIAVHQFADEKVRAVFEFALYHGPFADEHDPHWWRNDLDELVHGAGEDTGRGLANKKLKRKLRSCADRQRGTRRLLLYGEEGACERRQFGWKHQLVSARCRFGSCPQRCL